MSQLEAWLSWDELWMATAHLVGRRSRCARRRYGAVIVSPDNRALSVGYNGPPAGHRGEGPCTNWCARGRGLSEADQEYLDCPSIHAEQNALLRAPTLWGEHATLYVNGVTCLRCALVIANSGISHVVMFADAYEQKRDPAATARLLEEYNVRVTLT